MSIRTLSLCFALSGCLNVENVGSDDPPCPDPAEASTAEAREVCLKRVIAELSHGSFRGKAVAGPREVAVEFEFTGDGSYRVSSRDENASAFAFFFLTDKDDVDGQYRLTDVVDGKFYGYFERPWGQEEALRSDLEELVLENEDLTFWWRTTLADLSVLKVQMVLTRHR